MKTKTLVGVGVLGVAVLLLVGFAWDRRLQESLPEKEVYPTKEEALLAAFRDNNNVHRPIGNVLGTGSMAPFIRKSDDPNEIVAYTITDPNGTYDTIKVGQLGLYKPSYQTSHPDAAVIHVLAKRKKDGLIFTGLANKSFETRTLVTRENFLGVIKKVYTWEE